MIDKIIERLQREKLIAFETLANTGNEKFDFAYLNVGNYADRAIDTVKQVAEEENCEKCKHVGNKNDQYPCNVCGCCYKSKFVPQEEV